ncbi:MAG: sulfotransferase family 2 domain-containing protein [Pseudomonadota bacterium]
MGAKVDAELFFRRHVLIHCHIEKTAGSSLVHAFRRWFGVHVLDLRRRGSRRPRELKPGQRASVWMLSGHFAAHAHDEAFARRCRHIACVREPAARFQSYVRYVQRGPGHPAFAHFNGLTMPEAAHWAVQKGHHAATNPMSRLLEQRPTALMVPQQRLHDMLAHLAPAFGRQPLAPVRNVNPGNGSLDEEAAAIIRAANATDAALFEQAEDRFEDWLALPQTLDALLNAAAARTVPRQRPRSPAAIAREPVAGA